VYVVVQNIGAVGTRLGRGCGAVETLLGSYPTVSKRATCVKRWQRRRTKIVPCRPPPVGGGWKFNHFVDQEN